jgi:uncharacterized protein (UPF0305 family)
MSDLRTALEEALDKTPLDTAADPVTADDFDEPSPGPESSGLEPGESSGDSAAPTIENSETPGDLNAAAEAEGRKRDAQGKFAPNQPKPEENQGITPAPKAGEPPRQQNIADKAPNSWKPEIRAHWDKLPESVRETVATRERQIQQVLNETAEARKFAEAVSKTIQPYQAMLQAEGMHPIGMVQDLLQTAQALRTSPPEHKAQLVAAIVGKFGIDINMLDKALSGQAPQVDPVQNQVQQMVQQQMAPIQQQLQQFQQMQYQQQQMAVQQSEQQVHDFISAQPFGNDVRNVMADIIEVGMRQGRDISLQEAYDQACYMDPGIRGLLQQQQQSQGLQAKTQAAARARSAAVSIAGAPSAGQENVQQADSVRAAIEQALARNSR